MCAKVEFQIQILHYWHLSNTNHVYTVSVGKINSKIILKLYKYYRNLIGQWARAPTLNPPLLPRQILLIPNYY